MHRQSRILRKALVTCIILCFILSSSIAFALTKEKINHPPDRPDKPSGPPNGKAGETLIFNAVTNDSDNDKIAYLFEWGDGTTSGWTEFFPSGESATAFHSWEKGTYVIRVKAKDTFGAESDWSDPFNPICISFFIVNTVKNDHSILPIWKMESTSNGENDTTPPVTTRTLKPPEPDGLNGWYVCDVYITLNATDDLSGVKKIIYIIDGTSVHTIYGDYGSFILVGDGEYTIEYYAIDNAGNVETRNEFKINIDQNVPKCNCICKVVGGNPYIGWDFLFITTSTDEMSGMERVEFYFNSELQETVYGPGPEYTWQLRLWPIPRMIFRAIAYDNAGLLCIDEPYLSRTSYSFLNSFFSKFPIIERLLLSNKIMNILF